MISFLETLPDRRTRSRASSSASRPLRPTPPARPDADFEDLGPLLDEPAEQFDSHRALAAAGRKWGAKQVPVATIGSFGQLSFNAAGAAVLIGSCREHDSCHYKYRLTVAPNSRGMVSGKGVHGTVAAVARRSAANPITRVQQREIRARSDGPADGRRKRPLEIAAELVGTPAQYPPGGTIRRIRRRLLPPPRSESTVADIEAWCAARAWSFSDEHKLPEDPSKFAVVWREVRNCRARATSPVSVARGVWSEVGAMARRAQFRSRCGATTWPSFGRSQRCWTESWSW